ncbi:cation:proton antiporter, partial [Chloroflexota bacterium]
VVVFIGLVVFAVLFSRYAERYVTSSARKVASGTGLTLLISGIGFVVAAVVGLLGSSVVIGAFFAGIAFSRDPETVKIETPFAIVYDLFTPFFFINIGLSIDPGMLTTALGLGGVLLAVAVIGKVIGNGGPALLWYRWDAALLLGVSMVPRAEMAMVIMHKGLLLGDWAVPNDVYSAMVFVSVLTAIIPTVALYFMLKRWPQR